MDKRGIKIQSHKRPYLGLKVISEMLHLTSFKAKGYDY